MSHQRIQFSDGGRIARLTIESGRGNVLTIAAIRELSASLEGLSVRPALRAVVLDGAGGTFSYGAAVEEHLPERVREMLGTFHGLLKALLRFPVPVIAAVRGHCLGGGLEVALACSRIVAGHDAKLGQPEIKLGVFAPAASVLLPSRIGEPAALDLLLSGRVVEADEAKAIGLIDQLTAAPDDPAEVARAWAHLLLAEQPPLALRVAHRALRGARAEEAIRKLDDLTALYLSEIAPSAEANEGLRAFLERRAPAWAGAPGDEPAAAHGHA